jgi:hypothetical protein
MLYSLLNLYTNYYLLQSPFALDCRAIVPPARNDNRFHGDLCSLRITHQQLSPSHHLSVLSQDMAFLL